MWSKVVSILKQLGMFAVDISWACFLIIMVLVVELPLREPKTILLVVGTTVLVTVHDVFRWRFKFYDKGK